MTLLEEKKIFSTLPISNPLLNKNPLNLPYHALEVVSAHTRPFTTYALGGETQHSQTQVVASHKPLPPRTH
jgi:hypothetical protein